MVICSPLSRVASCLASNLPVNEMAQASRADSEQFDKIARGNCRNVHPAALRIARMQQRPLDWLLWRLSLRRLSWRLPERFQNQPHLTTEYGEADALRVSLVHIKSMLSQATIANTSEHPRSELDRRNRMAYLECSHDYGLGAINIVRIENHRRDLGTARFAKGGFAGS